MNTAQKFYQEQSSKCIKFYDMQQIISSSPANSMNIGFHTRWKIEVDHVRHVLEINSS